MAEAAIGVVGEEVVEMAVGPQVKLRGRLHVSDTLDMVGG